MKHDAKVTYLSPECMQQHKEGYILNNNKNKWFFKPGRSFKSKHKYIPLVGFQNSIQRMITTTLLFKGWITIKQATKENIYKFRNHTCKKNTFS